MRFYRHLKEPLARMVDLPHLCLLPRGHRGTWTGSTPPFDRGSAEPHTYYYSDEIALKKTTYKPISIRRVVIDNSRQVQSRLSIQGMSMRRGGGVGDASIAELQLLRF